MKFSEHLWCHAVVVVHLYSNFSVDLPNFFIGANLYQKLQFFATFEVEAHILKPER